MKFEQSFDPTFPAAPSVHDFAPAVEATARG